MNTSNKHSAFKLYLIKDITKAYNCNCQNKMMIYRRIKKLRTDTNGFFFYVLKYLNKVR